jgi:WD40 repeat protein
VGETRESRKNSGGGMKISKNSKLNNLFCQSFVIFILLTLTTSIGGCFSIFENKDTISNLSFSPDGKKVVFDRCPKTGCQIQVYNLETGELTAYKSPLMERWTMGKYNDDGKKITFSVIPIKITGGLDLGEMQIAVMDADGKNLKKVTTGPSAKLYPTFSHNGKKILYACAARIRKSGKTPAADYDAWEVDLTTGKQTRLTFFEYFYMGNLTYFPDDERFIYYGELPDLFDGVRLSGDRGAFEQKMIALARNGLGIHAVVVMKGKELIPNPYDFGDKVIPGKPLLSQDGSRLLFQKLPSQEFYLYSAGGDYHSAGGGGSLDSAAISPDGELLGINYDTTINIYTIQNGKLKQILYVSYAKKAIVNWEEAYKGSENLYRMIPEKPLRILN